MRVLSFIVKEQSIEKDQDCDFDNIIANSEGYLQARFTFEEPWFKLNKVVEFSCLSNDEAVVLDKTNACIIPSCVLKNAKVGVKVVGVNASTRIETNKTYFIQDGS